MNRATFRFRNLSRTGVLYSGSVDPEPVTSLRRESDGTVTVLSLGNVSTLSLTRQPDGTVIVGEM